MNTTLNAVAIPVSTLQSLINKHEMAVVGYEEFKCIEKLYKEAVNNRGYLISSAMDSVVLLPLDKVKHLLDEHARSVVDYDFMNDVKEILSILPDDSSSITIPCEPTYEIISTSLEGMVFPAYVGSDTAARESFKKTYLDVVNVVKRAFKII